MNIFTTWGSSTNERKLHFTCDRFIKDRNGAYFRAVDIDAPSHIVFRWLCQMKIAPYSYDKLDNGGKRSPLHLTTGAEKLQIGDRMMTIFRLDHFIQDKEITLVMTIPSKPYDKYYVPTAITYRILPASDGKMNHCRLLVKYVARWENSLFGQMERLLVIFADFIMMRRQLLNFKQLAERDYLLQNHFL